MDPVYDDVLYMIDGLQRLNTLDTGGFRKFCDSLVQAPPHSPWSTGLAVAAFALFGIHDWAPYVFNGSLVFFFLLVAARLVDVESGLVKAAILSIILLLQLTFSAVHELRPDFAVALFTATFSLLLVKMACYDEEPAEARHHFCVGLVVGLAYLTKPTFFAHTTVMLCASIFLAEICRRFVSNGRVRLARAISRLLAVFTGALLVSGPYFLLSWRQILDYFFANTGDGKFATLWKIQGGPWSALSLYVLGYPAKAMLGSFYPELLFCLLAGFVFSILTRNRRASLFTLSGIALAAVSLAILSFGGMDNIFFGFTWEIVLLLTVIYSLGEMFKTKGVGFGAIIFCVLSVFVFYESGWAQNIWTVTKDTAGENSINETIVRQVSAHAASDLRSKPPTVYMSFAGNVDVTSQSWLALKQNLNIQFDSRFYSGAIEEHLAQIQHADFVEVADPASKWLYKWQPGWPLQSELLNRLRDRPDFEELPPIKGAEGTVFLFERKVPHEK